MNNKLCDIIGGAGCFLSFMSMVAIFFGAGCWLLPIIGFGLILFSLYEYE